MLCVLSPAKKQDFESCETKITPTQPETKKQIAELFEVLKNKSASDLKALMNVSDKIAELNFERYQSFDPKKYNKTNSKAAVLALQGDVYRGLDAASLKKQDLDYAQDHLRILSGLYGCLRPLDYIQPYRLEMKTPLVNPKGKNLYEFWGTKLSELLNKSLRDHKNPTLINLASQEYFKAIDKSALSYPVIHIDFKEKKNGDYKTIGIMAKYARGLMARYLIEHKIDDVEAIKQFNVDKYRFNKKMSSDDKLVFTRK